jgi:hypothetical protein
MVELKAEHNVQSNRNILQYRMSVPRSTSNPNTGGMFGKFKFSTKTKTIMSPANFTTLPNKNKAMIPNNTNSSSAAVSVPNAGSPNIELKSPVTLLNKNPIEKPQPVPAVTVDNSVESKTEKSTNVINSCEKTEMSHNLNNDKNNNSDEKIDISNVKAEMQKMEKGNNENILSCNNKRKKIFLHDVHPYITCTICKGYLIDPCSIIECGHSCKLKVFLLSHCYSFIYDFLFFFGSLQFVTVA